MPADEGPSLARTRTVPCSMMSRLRDDSQRTAAESTRAPRLALEQQQELEPKTLEQQLKDNEACGLVWISRLFSPMHGAGPPWPRSRGASTPQA